MPGIYTLGIQFTGEDSKKELYFGWLGQERPSDVISVMVWS